jgi:arsenate reductase
MNDVTIYHNPRCSKSRQTLALLKDRGIEPTVVEYLKEPPSAKRLDELCTLLGREPLQVMRTKEARFKELGLSGKDERPRAEWLDLMHDNPILIERPIVVSHGKAVIGRPPESALDIL